MDREGRVPPGLDGVRRPDQAMPALPVPSYRLRAPHEPGLIALVPAHPEDVHRERARGRRGEERESLPGPHAGLARVAHHRVGRPLVPDPPVRIAGQRVLTDRAGTGTRAGGDAPRLWG